MKQNRGYATELEWYNYINIKIKKHGGQAIYKQWIQTCIKQNTKTA